MVIKEYYSLAEAAEILGKSKELLEDGTMMES